MPVILTTSQIQDVFEIKSSGTMTKIKGRGADTAIVGRNSWDLKLFLDWWLDNMVDSAIGEAGDDTLAAAKVEYWKAKAERERIKADRDRGELIHVAEVHHAWALRVAEVAAGLETFKDRLPPLLLEKTREEMRQVLDDEVWRLRDTYARGGQYTDLGDELRTVIINYFMKGD
jgi:phage terminase Nu1 subunit (DNA packaging protein)